MRIDPRPLALDVENVTLSFGGLVAVDDFSLAVHEGEIVGLIGPNGAGKTTLFNILSGIYRPQNGCVRIYDQDAGVAKPHERVAMGLVRTFQNIRLFKNLTVEANIRVASHHRVDYGLGQALAQTAPYQKGEALLASRAARLLEALELSDRRDALAGALAYGDRKKLEIARAVATGASVLLLDEPAAGMNPQESQWLMGAIRRVREEFNLTVLLIEHDMRVVMGLCGRVVVMDHGVKISEGTPAEVQSNPRVIEAYLGTKKTEE